MKRKNKVPNTSTGIKRAKNTKEAIKTLLSYCKNYYVTIITALIAAIIGAILSVIGPNLVEDLVNSISDGVSETSVNIDMTRITEISIILICVYVGSFTFEYLQSNLMAKVSCLVGKKMRSDISLKINTLPLRYFDTHTQGDILSRVTNDVDTVTQSLNLSVGTLVTAIATILGSTIMMFITEWRMALTTIIPSLVGFGLMIFIMKISQKHFVARQKTLGQLNGHIEEYYTGQSVVWSYNGEEKAHDLFSENNEKLRKLTFKSECISGLMKPIMNFAGNFGYLAVGVVGAVLTFNGEASFSIVVAFMIYVRLFTSPLSQLGQGFSTIQSALAACEHVKEFLDEEELSDESNKTTVINNVKGEVTFDHVNFGYLPNRTIVNDFSFKVKPGQKIAIVGPTGAGKSTLVNLLMRFYDLNSGNISVDGVSLNDIKREEVHKMFGMVLQETWLFNGTIRENLVYGKDNISDEKLISICNQCGLKQFISSLPDGLDTILGDNVSLSVGEKQLLTIARAMVADSPLLILDEATPSVDTRTEIIIQKAMDSLTKGRTSFVIAHRLSTIINSDVIIYMQGGDIKETGTHKELMNKNGYYAELYNSQFDISA